VGGLNLLRRQLEQWFQWLDYVFGDVALELPENLSDRQSSVGFVPLRDRASVAQRYVEGDVLVCVHSLLKRVSARERRGEDVTGFELCAVFGIEAVSEWPPAPSGESVLSDAGKVAGKDVGEPGGVKCAVLVRVPERLEQPERVVAVPSFVRLRPINDCLGLWPETVELLRQRASYLAVGRRIVKEDRKLDSARRGGAGARDSELPGEVVEGGAEVVYSISDDGTPHLIRREPGNLQVDGEVPVVALVSSSPTIR
jgi:hypothetical protein